MIGLGISTKNAEMFNPNEKWDMIKMMMVIVQNHLTGIIHYLHKMSKWIVCLFKTLVDYWIFHLPFLLCQHIGVKIWAKRKTHD